METKDIMLDLRQKHGLTQDEMAEKLFVTRQAVSRWETGETQPNTETLKVISKTFDVSINTLLGQPQKLQCQSCGMPLHDDATLSKEADGAFNESYCKWCYADGHYLTECTMDEMIEQILPHMNWPDADKAREFLRGQLPGLKRWQIAG
ncbi:MAG: helix-turn-helix domain-containing protein [Clostridia bacterium]|nr:helix-turn-helix domain-containing protein [Clostridia bacterium]